MNIKFFVKMQIEFIQKFFNIFFETVFIFSANNWNKRTWTNLYRRNEVVDSFMHASMFFMYVLMYIIKVPAEFCFFWKNEYFEWIKLRTIIFFFFWIQSGYGSPCITLKSVTTTLFQVPESDTKIREKTTTLFLADLA